MLRRRSIGKLWTNRKRTSRFSPALLLPSVLRLSLSLSLSLFFLSSFFLLPFSHTSSSSHPSISRSDLLLYHLISFTMFAARSSFNLFQKRAFSASARQVGTAACCLVNLGRSARINANLFFPFILRPPRSPSWVPVVALASLCPSCLS